MSSVDDDRAADTGSGWVIPRAISLALVLTPLAGAVLVLAAVLSAVVPMVYRSLTPDQSGLIPAAREEFSAALKEHQAIVRVAEVCAATITDDGGRSLTGEPFVSLDVKQPLANTVPAEADPAAREAPGYLDAALYLSNAIVLARAGSPARP